MRRINVEMDYETASRFMGSLAHQGVWRASRGMSPVSIAVGIRNGLTKGNINITVSMPVLAPKEAK